MLNQRIWQALRWIFIQGILTLVVLCGLVPQDGQAKIGDTLTLEEESPVQISAEKLSYIADKHLFIAEGGVEITYRKANIYADYIEFNEETGDALAIGNVLYEEEGEKAIADQLEFNFDTQKGIVKMGQMALADDQYITGKEIVKIGEKQYEIHNGTFSACNTEHPAWKLGSTTAIIHEEQYLQAWNTVGYIKGIPVFYFPYFVYPIKTERQTGLLVPGLGYSTTRGFHITNQFFWALGKSQDATFGHTYTDERGNQFDLEYRYLYSETSKGNLTSSYARDTLDQEDKWRFLLGHEQSFPWSIRGVANVDWTSDSKFDENFSEDYDERTNTKLHSSVSLTRNFSQHSFRLLLDQVDDLTDSSKERKDRRLPDFSFTSQKQQVFGTPLYLQQKTQVARLQKNLKKEVTKNGETTTKEETTEFSRVDVNPTFSVPFNLLGPALSVNPQVELRWTYYTHDAATAENPDLAAKSIDRQYYATSLRFDGPKVQRIFDLGVQRRVQKLKHLIEPNLTFSYAPGIDESDYPKFDSVDRIGSINQTRLMSYGITQRILSKRVTEEEWTRYQDDPEEVEVDELGASTTEIVTLDINQSYNFEADEYPLSNIDMTLKFDTPGDRYELTLRSGYDMYMTQFVRTDIDFQGTLWEGFTAKATWRREASVNRAKDLVTSVTQFLDVDTQLTLFTKFGLSYRGRFNLETNERIEDNVGFNYTGQCWTLTSSYTQQFVSDEWDQGFRILIELKHLGKLFDING